MSVLPQHKTDAIFRVENKDRYDDRDVITTNLIDSYERLISFGQKHLNDLFVLDGIVNVNARDRILREIVSNTLAHRDYSSGFPSKMIIDDEKIVIENSNLSHGIGPLDIQKFEPFPKNPSISKVFREIGLADELGSGMRNTYKYTQLYSKQQPLFEEGDIFRTIIPLKRIATQKVGVESDTHDDTHDDTHGDTHDDTQEKIIRMIETNPKVSTADIAKELGLGIATVKRKIKKIPNISYVGSGNNGHWERVCVEIDTQDVAQDKNTLIEFIKKKVRNNDRVTRKEIADEAGVSLKTIERIIKEIDDLRYVGSGYSGHWEKTGAENVPQGDAQGVPQGVPQGATHQTNDSIYLIEKEIELNNKISRQSLAEETDLKHVDDGSNDCLGKVMV